MMKPNEEEIETIKECLELCVQSYKEEITAKDYQEIDKYEGPKWSANLFIGIYKKDTFTVIFRGTDDEKTFMADIKVWSKQLPYPTSTEVQVHSGFIDAYLDIRTQIHNHYKQHKDLPKVLITGHSLGGALATLCALDLQYNFISDKNIELQCITFGSPRVGDKAFVKSYNNRVPNTWRVVNRGD